MKGINNNMSRILYKQIPQTIKANILLEYNANVPSTTLHKKYNLAPATVLRIVRELGGNVKTMKEAKTKYSFNHSFFNKIDTEEKAYFLGLLLADGHTSYKEVMLYLNVIDKHIINKFVESIQGDNKVAIRSTKAIINNKLYISKSVGVSLRSDQMLNDLKKLGFTSNKTYTMKVPKIKKELQKHFWRGVWDGDGYISYYRGTTKQKLANNKTKQYNYLILEAGLCGLKNIVEEFCEFLKQNNIKPGKIYPDGSIYSVRCNWTESYKLLNLFYSDFNPELCLKRKYNKYLEYQKLKSI